MTFPAASGAGEVVVEVLLVVEVSALFEHAPKAMASVHATIANFFIRKDSLRG